MDNKTESHLIKSISIIINLTKKREIEIKKDSTINSLENEHQFKLKKTKKSFILKKIEHHIIFLDNKNNTFILLKKK